MEKDRESPTDEGIGGIGPLRAFTQQPPASFLQGGGGGGGGSSGGSLPRKPSPRETIPLHDYAQFPDRMDRLDRLDSLQKIHVQSSAETSGLGDSLQRIHTLSSTETSGYGDTVPSPTGFDPSPVDPIHGGMHAHQPRPSRSMLHISHPGGGINVGAPGGNGGGLSPEGTPMPYSAKPHMSVVRMKSASLDDDRYSPTKTHHMYPKLPPYCYGNPQMGTKRYAGGGNQYNPGLVRGGDLPGGGTSVSAGGGVGGGGSRRPGPTRQASEDQGQGRSPSQQSPDEIMEASNGGGGVAGGGGGAPSSRSSSRVGGAVGGSSSHHHRPQHSSSNPHSSSHGNLSQDEYGDHRWGGGGGGGGGGSGGQRPHRRRTLSRQSLQEDPYMDINPRPPPHGRRRPPSRQHSEDCTGRYYNPATSPPTPGWPHHHPSHLHSRHPLHLEDVDDPLVHTSRRRHHQSDGNLAVSGADEDRYYADPYHPRHRHNRQHPLENDDYHEWTPPRTGGRRRRASADILAESHDGGGGGGGGGGEGRGGGGGARRRGRDGNGRSGDELDHRDGGTARTVRRGSAASTGGDICMSGAVHHRHHRQLDGGEGGGGVIIGSGGGDGGSAGGRHRSSTGTINKPTTGWDSSSSVPGTGGSRVRSPGADSAESAHTSSHHHPSQWGSTGRGGGGHSHHGVGSPVASTSHGITDADRRRESSTRDAGGPSSRRESLNQNATGEPPLPGSAAAVASGRPAGGSRHSGGNTGSGRPPMTRYQKKAFAALDAGIDLTLYGGGSGSSAAARRTGTGCVDGTDSSNNPPEVVIGVVGGGGSRPGSGSGSRRSSYTPTGTPTLSRSGSTNFLGVYGQSTWLKWSQDRRNSFKKRLDCLEERQKELERTRVSTPVRKARKESVMFVSPEMESKHVLEEAEELDIHGLHHSDPGGPPRPPVSTAPPEKLVTVPMSGKRRRNMAKDEVKLTVNQWNGLVAFWEHTVFVRCRYGGTLLSLLALILTLCSIGNSDWFRQSGE